MTTTTKRVLLTGGALALAVAMFLAGRAAAPDPAGDAAHAAHDHDDGDETVYYCSMHPDQQSTDPDDTCPICGMDLIPMPDDGDPSEAGMPILRLSERSAALLRAEVAPVERRGADHRLDVQGNVDLDETRVVEVVARSDGFVERQHAAYRWQTVRRGQPLASIYSPAITAAARELLVLQRTGAGRTSQLSLASGKEKLRRLGAPQEYIQRVLDSGEVPRTYTLRSPASGVITELDGREGQSMREGQRLVQIADLSRVWVQLQAYESEVRSLRVGQRADVRARAHPDRVFEARVAFIDPAVDPQRRTVRVRLEVNNPDGALRPGMFVRGLVEGEGGSGGREAEAAPLVIPRTAPLITGRRAVVYVQRRDGDQLVFEGRDVELGPRVGEIYEVLSGLEEGELVVTRGAFLIDSELQIRGRPSMMTPGDFFARGDDHERLGEALLALDPDDVPEPFSAGAREVMERYFELIAALADDDFGRAQAAAESLHDDLRGVDHDELPTGAIEAWGDIALALTAPLATMTSTEDIEEARAALEPMAEPIQRIAEFLAKATGAEIYRGTCPMTPGGTGHWLQPDDDIANPYMGQSMLSCGTIEAVSP